MDSKMIFDVIGHISNVLGIGGTVFAFSAWLLLMRQNKNIRESFMKLPPMKNFQEAVTYHSEVQTLSPHAVAISVIPSGSIRRDVGAYLVAKGGRFSSMPIVDIAMPEGLNHGNLESFINKLRETKAFLNGENATEIHLFIAGPVQAGTMCGMIFDNWKPVKLYSPNGGSYEYWCPLIKR